MRFVYVICIVIIYYRIFLKEYFSIDKYGDAHCQKFGSYTLQNYKDVVVILYSIQIAYYNSNGYSLLNWLLYTYGIWLYINFKFCLVVLLSI